MLSFVASLLVTAGLAPAVRRVVLSRGLMDVPNHRSSHSVPVPRGGGIACLVGVLAGGLAARQSWGSGLWPVLAVAATLALVGLADDRNGLAPSVRLLAQLAGGALAGLALGEPTLAIAGLLVLPTVVNAVNFMDGINGITGLTMAVWGVSAAAAGHSSGNDALLALGAATAGAALGFLPLNLGGRMFLGDVGSYLFGALVGGGILLAWSANVPVMPLLAPLALYAVDTASTVVRRAARGEELTQAHRDHVYQRLTSGAGLPHLPVAAFAAGLAGIVTLAWWVAPAWVAAVVCLVACALYLLSPTLLRASPANA